MTRTNPKQSNPLPIQGPALDEAIRQIEAVAYRLDMPPEHLLVRALLAAHQTARQRLSALLREQERLHREAFAAAARILMDGFDTSIEANYFKRLEHLSGEANATNREDARHD